MVLAHGRTRYDASVLNAFIRMMGVYPPGSVVQLVNDRYAMVVSVNSSRPLRPRVIVHDARVPRDEALILDLETVPELVYLSCCHLGQVDASIEARWAQAAAVFAQPAAYDPARGRTVAQGTVSGLCAQAGQDDFEEAFVRLAFGADAAREGVSA